MKLIDRIMLICILVLSVSAQMWHQYEVAPGIEETKVLIAEAWLFPRGCLQPEESSIELDDVRGPF